MRACSSPFLISLETARAKRITEEPAGWSAGPGRLTISRVPDGAPDDERDLYRDDQWTWATEQAEALRRRDPDALDWEHLLKDPADLASGIRCDWVSRCVQAVENMLLIEHYPAPAEKISLWRARAWRRRCDLGYVHKDNPGLVKRHLGELLAESWLLARDEAIGSMAKLDSTGLSSSEWKDLCGRWDRYLPGKWRTRNPVPIH